MIAFNYRRTRIRCLQQIQVDMMYIYKTLKTCLLKRKKKEKKKKMTS